MRKLLVLMIFPCSFAAAAVSGPGLTEFDRYNLGAASGEDAAKLSRFLEAAKPGGTFTQTDSEPNDLIYPFQVRDGRPIQAYSGDYTLYEPLAVTSSLNARTLQALVAERFWLEDNLLTIQIHPSAKFWDGTAVTAEHMKLGAQVFFEAYGDKKFMKDIFQETQIEVLSPQRMQVRFKGLAGLQIRDAVYYFLANTCALKPMPKSSSPHIKLDQPYMGTGPYQIELSDRYSITLKRRPDYWAENLPIRKGQFNFEKLVNFVVRERNAARETFLAKQSTVFYVRDAAEEEYFKKPGANAFKRIRIERPARDIHTGMLALNQDRPHTGKLRFRQALNFALDWDWINTNYYGQSLSRLEAPAMASATAPRGALSKEARALLTEAGVPIPAEFEQDFAATGFSAVHKPLPRRERLAKAMELLKAEGYEIQGTTLMFQSKPVKLVILTPPEFSFMKGIFSWRENLAALGIHLDFRSSFDSASFTAERKRREYDIVPGGIAFTRQIETINANYLRQHLHSSYAGLPDVVNASNMRSPLFDWLVEGFLKTPPGDPKFGTLTEILIRALSATMPMVMIGERTHYTAYTQNGYCFSGLSVNAFQYGYHSEVGCP